MFDSRYTCNFCSKSFFWMNFMQLSILFCHRVLLFLSISSHNYFFTKVLSEIIILGQPSALSGSSSVSSGLPAAGKQPTAAGSSSPQQMILDGAKKLVPTSSKYSLVMDKEYLGKIFSWIFIMDPFIGRVVHPVEWEGMGWIIVICQYLLIRIRFNIIWARD